jgi:predicted nucleic acid-binding Zn ribbon protein
MDDLEKERRRLQRNQQPAVKRREAERAQRKQKIEEWYALYSRKHALAKEQNKTPLYEVLADAFNLRSARFAPIRPRLIAQVRLAIVECEAEAAWDAGHGRRDEVNEVRLGRAREILNLLEPDPHRACASCGKLFLPTRRDAVTCSPACRQREYRKRVTNKGSVLVDP